MTVNLGRNGEDKTDVKTDYTSSSIGNIYKHNFLDPFTKSSSDIFAGSLSVIQINADASYISQGFRKEPGW